MRTEEEVKIRLNVDASGIDRAMGIGSDKLSTWKNRVKTEEEKYTDWWKTELAKREEQEVAASVRAASRSNQARRLLRARAEDQAQRLQETVGQGSIPESWQKMTLHAETSAKSATAAFRQWGANTSEEIGKTAGFFGFAFENSFHHTMKSLKRIFAINMVELALQAREYWDKFSNYAAESIYGVGDRITNLRTRLIESQNAFIGKQREEQAERNKADAEERASIVSKANEYLKLQGEIGKELHRQTEARNKLNNAHKITYEEMRRQQKLTEDTLKMEVAIAESKLQQARNGGDHLKIAQAELDLAKARADQTEQQVQNEQQRADLAEKQKREREAQIEKLHAADPFQKAAGAGNILDKDASPAMKAFLENQKLLDPSYRAPFAAQAGLKERNKQLFGQLSLEEQAAVTAAKGPDQQMKEQTETLRDLLKSFTSGTAKIQLPDT